MSVHEKYVKNQLICLLGKNLESLNFINDLVKTGDLLFFGGSIRDICMFPENPPEPRDFDIAIKFKDLNKFEEVIKKYDFKTNRFGGYKFNVNNIEFDVWDLENTWAFNNTNLIASEENLAKSVYLNIDGIVYNFNKSRLYDEIFKNFISKCILDINLELNPQIELNLLRAMVFKDKYKGKYNLKFSSKLRSVYKKCLHENPLELANRLYELQFGHYKTYYLSKEEILREVKFI